MESFIFMAGQVHLKTVKDLKMKVLILDRVVTLQSDYYSIAYFLLKKTNMLYVHASINNFTWSLILHPQNLFFCISLLDNIITYSRKIALLSFSVFCHVNFIKCLACCFFCWFFLWLTVSNKTRINFWIFCYG
jgi:hypothetical protein